MFVFCLKEFEISFVQEDKYKNSDNFNAPLFFGHGSGSDFWAFNQAGVRIVSMYLEKNSVWFLQ